MNKVLPVCVLSEDCSGGVGDLREAYYVCKRHNLAQQHTPVLGVHGNVLLSLTNGAVCLMTG